MKVKDYIARFLERKGIDTVFLLQGGMITNLVDSIVETTSIKVITMQHEQAAAFAVESYGKLLHKPAVALATSGPGATNLITGIASCYFDSVPAIFITGQVNSQQITNNPSIRQTGFQETNIVDMVAFITKATFRVLTANDIVGVLEKAYDTAMQGRFGPVLIDIPIDIQMQEILLEDKGTSFFEEFYSALQISERPLILAGNGLRASSTLFKTFLQQYKIPVVLSLLGLDVLEYAHSERVGFIGTYGNRWANIALADCDLLLVLGSRLDLRQTADVTKFKQGKKIFYADKKIYHVDLDDSELNHNVTGCRVSKQNVSDFLKGAIGFIKTYKAPIDWIDTIKLNSEVKEAACKGINPNVFIHKLSQASSLAKVFTADVGNNQMWTAQSIELLKSQSFLTSGGMGAMGYSLPAAIGASIALGNAPVVAIVGDGGLQINIQELQTIRRYNLPIKIVVLNNDSLGMIRQFQDTYFEKRHTATIDKAPSFVNIAAAYEIGRWYIDSEDGIEKGLEMMWRSPNSPFLLDVIIHQKTDVTPKVMFGNGLKD